MEVDGKPVREAVADLTQSLEGYAQRLDYLAARYRSYRPRRQSPSGFGLRDEFDACIEVLRAALTPHAEPDELRAVASALERLGRALRRIDMGRLDDVPDLLIESNLPKALYVLPRATELLVHWRRNAGEAHLQVLFEVQDDAAHDVLCLMCLDDGAQPAPTATVPLQGLAQYADLVEALGGQFHLWVARPAGPTGCRVDHGGNENCRADEYVKRIMERLKELSENMWYMRRTEILDWVKVIDGALRMKGNAAISFAVLPQMRE